MVKYSPGPLLNLDFSIRLGLSLRLWFRSRIRVRGQDMVMVRVVFTLKFLLSTQWRGKGVISHSNQCSTTGVTKAVVCATLSVGWCI